MQPAAIEQRDWRPYAVLLLAIVLSLGAHVALALGVSAIEPPEDEGPTWVTVTVNTPPPAPEPEPEPAPVPEPEPEPEPEPQPRPQPQPDPRPQPEPQPAPPEPEQVDFDDTTPDDVASEPPPPEAPRTRRLTQGLSNDSFTEGGIDIGARRGNTTSTGANNPQLSEEDDEPFQTVAYAAATTAPRLRNPPVLVVPDSVIDAQIQGRVEAELTIGADGSVVDIAIVGHLDPAADAACLTALRGSRWRPGAKEGTPVIVSGVPYSCRFAMTDP